MVEVRVGWENLIRIITSQIHPADILCQIMVKVLVILHWVVGQELIVNLKAGVGKHVTVD